ncbi:MAG: hypothetical protein JNM18_20585 [Planctomycetaceae bacterium]|nr:hypothetical protein [Planctomycetaceae bacterium]
MGSAPSAGARTIAVLVNPRTGCLRVKQEVARFQELARHAGWNVVVDQDLPRMTTEADRLHANHELKMLVGVGGDGTLAELVNRTEPGVPITLLAGGTANLLAKHFRLARDARQLLNIVENGRTLQMDVGRANGRLFIAMLSCGLDARVVQDVHAHRAAQAGQHSYWSFLGPSWRALWNYRYPAIRVSGVDDRAAAMASRTARWVFVCNLPRYGWGVTLAPRASTHDGLLDLCTFSRGSLLSTIGYLFATQLGVQRRLPSHDIRPVQRVRLECDERVLYQLDGDPGGELPVEVEILPQRLTLGVQ